MSSPRLCDIDPVREHDGIFDSMAENTYPARISIRSSEQLGDAVARSRKTKGYSQQEFADLAGVGRRFVSDLENGKPTAEIGKVLQVLTALGLDLELRAR